MLLAKVQRGNVPHKLNKSLLETKLRNIRHHNELIDAWNQHFGC